MKKGPAHAGPFLVGTRVCALIHVVVHRLRLVVFQVGERRGLDADIENLKVKVDAGVDFLVTQMFFDNDEFYKFRDKLAKKGINKPITAGIMPLTNAGQIQRMAILSGGASMPSKFLRMISKYQDNPEALKQAGIAYAVDQIIDLLSNDIDGIHLYTMNKPETAQKIVNVINNLFV